MIDIQWKGKVGYGDIVSPICYAHNLSYKLNTQVNLTFRWAQNSLQKSHPSDPETLWQRANFINLQCQKEDTNVNVMHRFSSPLDINHTNYDWAVVGKDVFHNYWIPSTANQQLTNTVVVNSTAGNVMSLQKYGKAWKDPLAGQWQKVIDKLSKHYNIVIVDYRTPVDRLVEVLQTAHGFVGYHGTAAWVARFISTPSILFSNGGSLTRNAFAGAHIETKDDNLDLILSNPEPFFNLSKSSIEKNKAAYALYTPSENFQRSLTYEL